MKTASHPSAGRAGQNHANLPLPTAASTARSGVAAGRSRSFLSRALTAAVVVLAALSASDVRADQSANIAVGGTVRLSVSADGSAPFNYQWFKNGAPINGANSAIYTFANAQSSDTGSYSVSVTNAVGSEMSDIAIVGVAVPAAPAIFSQPVSQNVSSGATTTLSVGYVGYPAPAFQWQRNGVSIPGANGSTYTISGTSAATAGSYTVVLTNSFGSVTSQAAVVSMALTSRLVNVSVRTFPGSGAQALIAGFVTAGGSKSIVVRGVGPGLAQYTSSPVAADPILSLFQGSNPSPLLTNEKWGGTSWLKDLFSHLGAFSLSDNSNDTAISSVLQPNVYSAMITGDGTGLALAEIYDADPTSGGRIVNLSARTQVNTGDGVLVAGFVITGTGPKQLLIRGVGPTLGTYGVGGTLVDPRLDLYVAGATTPIQSNDNWGGGAELTSAFTTTGAFPLADANSKDAAMLVTLNPGSYSVILSGVGNTTGVGLVEIYEMP